MDKHIIKELEQYAEILENHFHDMMDIEFTIEKGKIYILSARSGRRTIAANLKIVVSMFCEGKMDVEDVIRKIHYQEIADFLDNEIVVNVDELELLGQGMPASNGVGAAMVCFSAFEAKRLINRKIKFIFCQEEISPDMIEIIHSKYCCAVITARGGITSHAATVCRGIGIPCVSGIGSFNEIKKLVCRYNNEITVDGNNGNIYGGLGKIERNNSNLDEIKILYELLRLSIEYNIVTAETAPLVWRLWDVIVLHKRYGKDNIKRVVLKEKQNYISFVQPQDYEVKSIYTQLQCLENGNLIVEDLIGFLFDELSAKVSLGNHYLYMRPLLNPMEEMIFYESSTYLDFAGSQLTGVEFFHINRFVDFLLDIYSIKIYFSTEFFCNEYCDSDDKKQKTYFPLNYLDYTNPNGEGLIINTYKARKMAVYINDMLITLNDLPQVYHLLRRRKYHWSWYDENNISKKEIISYLKGDLFCKDQNTELYYLCKEMGLIRDNELTTAGISLVGSDNMKNNGNIDYILEEVILRGCNDQSSECNDFFVLIQKKDFKDLIALELYEYYFWDERHEYDLQILKEIVENIADYFANPEIMKQIESGFLQTLPSAIVVSMVAAIWAKIKVIMKKECNPENDNSSWKRIEKNMKKIDDEFINHDYIYSDDIEQIFGASREEIQPLLKLCGCKCYIHKNKNIWIKPGTKEERIKEILKNYRFKYK